MINLTKKFLLIIVIIFVGCIPTPKNNRDQSGRGDSPVSSDGNSNTSTPTPTNTTPQDGDVYWYSEGAKIDNTIAINSNIAKRVYLRGSKVQKFLETSGNFYSTTSQIIQYCLVINFYETNPSVKDQLRIRALPITYASYASGTVERLFRVDLPDSTDNQSTCQGTLYTTGSCSNGTSKTQSACEQANSTWIDTKLEITNAKSAFAPSEVCPTCSLTIQAPDIQLYVSDGGQIRNQADGNDLSTLVESTSIDLSALGLRIDPLGNTTSPTAGCTNSTCQAQNFDCCLENQCVKDGSLRPGATNEANYHQALTEVAASAYNFIKFPNIYFVCSNMPRPPETPPTPINPEEEANKRLKQAILDYKCLDGHKATNELDRDYSSCCLESSATCSSEVYKCLSGAKQTPLDYSGCCASGDSSCGASDYNNILQGSDVQLTRFQTVKNDVWIRCGCAAKFGTPVPYNPESVCPDFGLRYIYDASDSTKIVDVGCKIPESVEVPAPFQNLSINISGRTVPHRFYKADGTNVDDMTNLSSSDAQEGAPFYYLDDLAKVDPVSDKFNINSILGQMTVDLNQALPAQVVGVEYDQIYVIGVTSGHYSPCPSCVADSWAEAYSAHPSSNYGHGLQATGYTSSRFHSFSNTTNGNYEDTLFGRACFVPVTMLPFSHNKNSSLQTQRMSRLSTQAAYFINGYQRDWFGFNKGAIIGSFNGVSWFAIGSGRRVKATSNKLFLAINAPFGDLADPGYHVVSVVADLGNNMVANFDYDPAIMTSSPEHNMGASCQKYHQCETDTDCVTKLGWEYMCADISKYRTHWPKFNIDGDEVVNDQIDEASFLSPGQIIQMFPSTSSNKRCVYRGAGAPCKQNYHQNISSEIDVKHFTCASNFYCASLNQNEFNAEIVREITNPEVFLFGQETNILGRPQTYVGASFDLLPAVRDNIKNNGSIHSGDISSFGLCRPGKKLAAGHTVQHKDKDNLKRTDYISQVGSCDSTKNGDERVYSCPIIDSDPNSEEFGNLIFSDTSNSLYHLQNSCGNETQNAFGMSPFSAIEAEVVTSVHSLLEPTVVKDACFRRAGSACQTDLECAPNRLHEENSWFLGLEYFGNTEAEQMYWQEYLVCGQQQSEPYITASNYSTYDQTLNRCCREIGQTVTLFTGGDPNVIPELGSNNSELKTNQLTYLSPKRTGRYSRYSVVESLGVVSSVPYAEVPLVKENQTPKQYQWKTINEAASKTCCGSWVRKFSDGSHDWTNYNRLSVDIQNFQCINYESPLLDLDDPTTAKIDSDNYTKDQDKLCLSPSDGGCVQIKIPSVEGFELTLPYDILASESIGTLDTSPNSSNLQTVNSKAPYQPAPYVNPVSMENSDGKIFNYFPTQAFNEGVSFYLPIYIGSKDNIVAVKIRYKDANAKVLEDVDITASYLSGCVMSSNPLVNLSLEQWCIANDSNDKYNVFHIRANKGRTFSGSNWVSAGVVIEFNVIGTSTYVYDSAAAVPGEGMHAGNALYYLTKLGRFELIGIPQIYYEPIYCNSDRNKLVDGLFKLNSPTRTDFEAAAFDYDPNSNAGKSLAGIYDESSALISGGDPSNTSEKITFSNNLFNEQIFSAHEVICCIPLGHETPSPSSCCSNYGVTSNNKTTCKLPGKTDLNVYFNRFISGEGVGSDQPGGGLTDDDFIAATGEPKLTTEVYNKIVALGKAYCASGKVRAGAAFGNYLAEPNSGFFYQTGDQSNSYFFSIIDSIRDVEQNGTNSTAKFLEGYRWSHHYYCEPLDTGQGLSTN
ncbi:MAG: hypothetical protein ISR65_02790 [Bacteriovoracaceae bacterium]|nr:hypothetical protein [Bacteriovoracaceae bacterium]